MWCGAVLRQQTKVVAKCMIMIMMCVGDDGGDDDDDHVMCVFHSCRRLDGRVIIVLNETSLILINALFD